MENISLFIDIEDVEQLQNSTKEYENNHDTEYDDSTDTMSSYYNISSTDSSNSVNSFTSAPYDLFSLLNEIDYDENNASSTYALLVHYETNFNVKQLNLICDYYGIKPSKRVGKGELLTILVSFETDMSNCGIVTLRKQLWYFMERLKSDKFMKKFIIWK